jgi:probable F420-dependent oxidoreductase
MTSVPLGVTAPLSGCTARESFDIVRSARDWGYRSVWASEVDGPDAFTLLGALAATTDLDLGVGVVPVQTRTAFTLGMTAVSLAQLSGGRFVLGIGASSEVLVSRFGGQPFDRPLQNVREVALALRPILRGERSTYEGRYVRVGGYKSPTPPPAPVPLFFGSLNPRSLRLAGELADGLCVNQIGPHHVPAMLEEVHAGAKRAGRELGDFPVMARLFCAVTDDVPAARAAVARTFAGYVATSVYNRFYRWMGYEEEAEAIAQAAAAKDRNGMAAAFTGRMVQDLFLIGDASAVIARLRDYVDAGVTIPVVAPLAPNADAAAAMLREIGASWRPRS